MTQRKFETVSNSSEGKPWKPHMTEKNFMQMGTDNLKMGYLLSSRTIQGKDKPFDVYLIQVVNDDNSFGDRIEVIGDAVLTDKFKQIPFGSFISAEYKGRVHKAEIKKAPGYHAGVPFTQTNSYHNWEVGVDKNAIPYEEALATARPGEVPAAQTVAQTTPAPVKPAETPEFSDDSELPF